MKKMSKKKPAKMGRPRRDVSVSVKTLGSVRVTDNELDDYKQVADLEGMKRSAWIRETLNTSVKHVRKKHNSDD